MSGICNISSFFGAWIVLYNIPKNILVNWALLYMISCHCAYFWCCVGLRRGMAGGEGGGCDGGAIVDVEYFIAKLSTALFTSAQLPRFSIHPSPARPTRSLYYLINYTETTL